MAENGQPAAALGGRNFFFPTLKYWGGDLVPLFASNNNSAVVQGALVHSVFVILQ